LQILLLARYVSGTTKMGIVVPKHVKQAIRSAIKTSVASSWHFISTYLYIELGTVSIDVNPLRSQTYQCYIKTQNVPRS